MKKVQQVVSALLLVLLLMACAPKAVPQAPATAPAVPGKAAASTPIIAATAKPAWEEQWQKVVQGAQKERSLVLYTSLGALSVRS